MQKFIYASQREKADGVSLNPASCTRSKTLPMARLHRLSAASRLGAGRRMKEGRERMEAVVVEV